MLKRTASLNSYIHKTSSDTLFRSKSFHILPPRNILDININCQNPRLINGYMPAVRETEVEEAIKAATQLYQSIQTDGWMKHIQNITEREKAIYKIPKEARTSEDLWDMRCCITHNLLNKLTKLLTLIKNTGDTQNHAYFVCCINNKPIGAMLLRKYYSKHNPPYFPGISFIITHPGIQNCAYLLLEKAVNMSYKMGYRGKLKLTLATDELSQKVYEKMGFIKMETPDNMKMTLDPNENSAWTFVPDHGGYRFIGTCKYSQ